MTPRVRFAPSPTGTLHIGGVRTALFNWLFARRHGGQFLLRLEDTDRQRSLAEHEVSILEALTWLGLDYDEWIVRQSSRHERHVEVAGRLLAQGKAYRCYCTSERLEQLRNEQRERKETPRYDGLCREVTDADETRPHTLRLKLPREGAVSYEDVILGAQRVENKELDDFIIQRADGTPTYNFVVAVDDHDMGITHVIRGSDHISNTPKQLHVYDALGWSRPRFAHCPNIHGSDGSKLSKRHGATNTLEYRSEGFLPRALLNYIVRLGWAHGDQEVFSLQEMIEAFSLEAVNRSPGVFDPAKLNWISGEHLRLSATEEVLAHWRPFLLQAGFDCAAREPEWLLEACDTFRERHKTLAEMTQAAGFLFRKEIQYDDKDRAKWLTSEAGETLRAARDALREQANDWRAPDLHAALQEVLDRRGIGMKQLAQPLRVALCGRAVSPPIDKTLALLGSRETLARIDAALRVIDGA